MQAMTVFCYNNEFRAVNRLGYCYGLLLYVHPVFRLSCWIPGGCVASELECLCVEWTMKDKLARILSLFYLDQHRCVFSN